MQTLAGELESVTVGQPIWARCGGCGWSLGVVVGIGTKFIHVEFPKRDVKCWTARGVQRGKRQLWELRARDPEKRGADRPPKMNWVVAKLRREQAAAEAAEAGHVDARDEIAVAPQLLVVCGANRIYVPSR
jgi:hypothetical protein